jgi:hypothetical protein
MYNKFKPIENFVNKKEMYFESTKLLTITIFDASTSLVTLASTLIKNVRKNLTSFVNA